MKKVTLSLASGLSSTPGLYETFKQLVAAINAWLEEVLPGLISDGVGTNVEKPGIIKMTGSANLPDGYLWCDGAAYNAVDYPDLFDEIGYTHGGAAGVFNVPDLRGKFPFGKAAAGTGSVLGTAFGAIDHVHTGAAHTHTFPHTHTISHTHTHAHTHAITHTHQVDPPNTTSTTPSAGSTIGLTPDGAIVAFLDDHKHDTNIAAFTSGGASTGSSSGESVADTSGPSAANSGAESTANTGAASAANTGTANPPGLPLNFIIKT